MGYFDKNLFTFLTELKDHNSREWFTANKHRYEQDVKEPLMNFISDAGPALHAISRHLVADPRPVGGSMFRIYRDVRFSKDKSPYKTQASAHFQLGGKGVHGPGYYLHLEPGSCFIAGGMWMPEVTALQKMREQIATSPADWRKARAGLDISEASLKRPPRGFDPEHPMIQDIKRKSFTSSHPMTQKQVLDAGFMKTFIAGCKEIAPLMRFLARAVDVPW